ncbi:hypothetical protein WT49_08575 [Burkholderia territorii]|nr:hypothetical protein WT50_26250 [Burkholderia territorii]KWE38758.1 hypothetical protein WT49_08575 [Burkholderia territorii]KWE53015.1 hypothetical protein WT51_07930 [Burkholderia territorii]
MKLLPNVAARSCRRAADEPAACRAGVDDTRDRINKGRRPGRRRGARLRATALQPDRIDATLAAGRCENDAIVAHDDASHTLGAIASWIRSQRMRTARRT